MKNCIACKHFYFNAGWAGTEHTPGNWPEADCEKGHWKLGLRMYDDGDALLAKTYLAETCPDFELSDLAKSKGWSV